VNFTTLYEDGSRHEVDSIAVEHANFGVIDIDNIKDELARTAHLYEQYTNKLINTRLAEMRAEVAYEDARLGADRAVRLAYESNGLKKPAEEQIKNEVRAHPDVVNAAAVLQHATQECLVAKHVIDVLARRDGAARTIAALIKAELHALD
jgi:hypothetical protein